MGNRGTIGRRLWGLALVTLLATTALALAIQGTGSGAKGAEAVTEESPESGVLPCKRDLTMTAAYRINGKIRFEGVADKSLRGKIVRVYEIATDEMVARTWVRRDGTWWADSSTEGSRYHWLTKFVAEAERAQSRWRRLGQAVAIRGRKPVLTGSRSNARVRSQRTRVQVKVSGDSRDGLVVGLQTGCLREEVVDKLKLRTGPEGVATISLPRPDKGDPYAIYRVRTDDGWKISPPIVIKPSIFD